MTFNIVNSYENMSEQTFSEINIKIATRTSTTK